MAFFVLTTSLDALSGVSGENNIFQFTPADLQSTDTVAGAVGAGFLDIMEARAGGTIAASQFSGVTNIEQLDLSGAGNNITLTDGLVSGSSSGAFTIVDGGGDDVVDGSGLSSTIPLVFAAAAGSDALKGGPGNDAFVFAATDLTSSDTVQGGAGVDSVYFRTAGAVAADAFANVSGIEAMVLNPGGNSIAL